MIDKPTNPTPYNSVIDPSDGISFKASCVNTNEISGMRLMLDDKSFQYCFPLSENTDYTFNNGEIAINIENNKPYIGYKVSNSNYERSDINQTVIPNILQSPKNYNWQMRLYQNTCRVNIAYGFIQTAFKDTAIPLPLYSSSANCVLMIRPHTNMFFDVNTDGGDFNKGVNPRNLLSYYDSKVKYEIEINGTRYPILAYYYSYGDENSADKRALQKDSYDDPLFAYIEIQSGATDISDNDEYSIYTNYIDSNEFYFQCRKNAELELKDRFNDPIDTFADGTSPSMQDNKFEITYSNFVLNGTYSQQNGADVSFYRVLLYQILDNGSEYLLDDTGEIYKSKITYNYDEFMGGELYKLVFQVTDSNRKSIVKSTYITPVYSVSIEPTQLNVQHYPEHNSILIDFSKLISISGHEEIQGACDFGTINVQPDISNNKWIIGQDGQSVNTCNIYTENSVTYDYIDGSNESLKCEHPLFSAVFKCTADDIQDIFEITDDNGRTHKVSWQGHHFVYTMLQDGRLNTASIYAPFQSNGFNPWHRTDEEKQLCVSSTIAALSKNTSSYDVPYYALDEIPTMLQGETSDYDGLYWHTESIARDFWWQIVFKPHYCYIKCLNAPQKYKYETETGGYIWQD